MSIASQNRADAETANLELLALAESNPQGLLLLLISRLCDDTSLDIEALTGLFKQAAKFQPTLDVDLARTLADNPELLADERLVFSVLQIIEGAGNAQRIMPILVRMQKVESPRVRSKVAMMLNRNKPTSSWLAQQLVHPDARVRASSLEIAKLTNNEATRHVLRSALSDPANRVVGNALLALYRLGDEDSITKLAAMGSHESPEFRATAAWVMGETGDSVFRRTLMEMRTREKDNVWLHVMQALTKINRLQADTLVRELTGAA